MEKLRAKKGYICDMDGVIYWGGRLLPGVTEFVKWLQDEGKQFLFLTNNSGQTPLELKLKLQAMGLDIDESHFYTRRRQNSSVRRRITAAPMSSGNRD